jgi:FOG: HPt domain
MTSSKTYEGPIDPAAKTALEELQSPGEPNLYEQVVEAFLEGSENYLELLSTDPSPDKINGIAHSWKSSSATLGALALSELCAELEAHPDRLHLVPQLAIEYKKVKTALNTP